MICRVLTVFMLVFSLLLCVCVEGLAGSTIGVAFIKDGGTYMAARTVSGEVNPSLAVSLLLSGPTAQEEAQGVSTAIPRDCIAQVVGFDGEYAVINISGIPAGTKLPDTTIDDILTQFMWTMRQFGLEARVLVDGQPISVLRRDAWVSTQATGVGLVPRLGAGRLSGKKICIRAGHGYKWDGSSWTTDRPVYCPPLSNEDFHNVDHAIMLKYFLEQEGATVIDTREMNKNRGNSPYAGIPWWQLCSGPYAYDKGYPPAVYAPYTGVPPGTPGVNQTDESRRVSCEMSDYDGADLYISLHTNGYQGNCYGLSCPSGLDVYYYSGKQGGNGALSYVLADNVVDNCDWAVDTYFGSFPCRNNCAPHDYAFTECVYPNAPACLLEFGFHDSCDLDGRYLLDPLFTSSGMYGVYRGICQFFGVTPSFDGYSAEYVSDTIPSTIVSGRSVSVSITFRNRGVAWSEDHQFRLGAVGDSDPFAAHRHHINGVVMPGGLYTFTFTMTAPITPGDYVTDWRMVRDGVTWFGDVLTKVVRVMPPPDTEPPTVPQNLRAVAIGTTYVDLQWDPSTDNESLSGYFVYRNGEKVNFVAAPTTAYRDTGLNPGTLYTYRVSAIDASSNESAQSDPLQVRTILDVTPPSAPTNVKATGVSVNRILVTWSASWDNLSVVKYRVYRNDVLVSEPTSTSFTDTGLSPGQAYVYRISAVDQSDNESVRSLPAIGRTYALGDTVLWSDNFESYSSQSAFEAVWPDFVAPGLTWSTARYYSPTHSLEETNTAMSSVHDLPEGQAQISVGTFLEFKFYDPSAATNVRHYGMLRSYTGGGHSGSIQQVLAIGCYNAGVDTSKYSGRAAFGGPNWFTLSVGRSVGWHTMRIDVTADTSNPISPGKGLARWTVDGVIAADDVAFSWLPFTCIVLGSGLSSTTAGNYYYDDVKYGVQGTVQTISGPDVVESPCGTITISWDTDVASDSRVDYGPTPAFGYSKSDPMLTKNHSITLTGLAGGSTYYYRVISTAPGKNSSVSNTYVFHTTSTSLLGLKNLPDGRRSGICGVVVSAVLPDGFYVQDTARTCGMRVKGTQNASVGDVVTIFGDLATVSGERMLNNAIVTVTGSTNPPKPLAMTNRALGGVPIAPNIPGVIDGRGPNNVGLLVKTWGRVVEVGNSVFWIDDGSQRRAAGGKRGIKVIADGIQLPALNSFVSVAGISGAETEGGLIYPVLRTRSEADIVTVGI
ncbi:MAG: fibronectin type III domain-containing protein [Armatimonadota bacterium]